MLMGHADTNQNFAIGILGVLTQTTRLGRLLASVVFSPAAVCSLLLTLCPLRWFDHP